ncbi:hypothetical protein [Micromonospora chalcea]|uniref:hypothetical protein n=1 Tax=Micromonospora chalcea TaxID=1874 RepID=UPI0011B07837|nr:hypothetical protein [Micromonospora chalcea]
MRRPLRSGGSPGASDWLATLLILVVVFWLLVKLVTLFVVPSGESAHVVADVAKIVEGARPVPVGNL